MQPCDRLTPKEVRVATLVWEGLTNREIASALGTTEQVVKNYLRKVYDKLGVADRLELALYCLSHHVVDGVKPPPVPSSTHPPADAASASSARAAGATASSASTAGSNPSAPDPSAPEKLN